jgi:hypothetical protein
MTSTKKHTEKLPPYLLYNKEKKLVCKIDRQSRKGEYFLAADSGSQQFVLDMQEVKEELHLIRNDLKEKVSRDEFLALEHRVSRLEKSARAA